jgi:hypothetical protein
LLQDAQRFKKSKLQVRKPNFYLKTPRMGKLILLLLFTVMDFSACNSNGKPKSVSADSAHKNSADSFKHDPTMPPPQNSDDPDRFSQ